MAKKQSNYRICITESVYKRPDIADKEAFSTILHSLKEATFFYNTKFNTLIRFRDNGDMKLGSIYEIVLERLEDGKVYRTNAIGRLR